MTQNIIKNHSFFEEFLPSDASDRFQEDGSIVSELRRVVSCRIQLRISFNVFLFFSAFPAFAMFTFSGLRSNLLTEVFGLTRGSFSCFFSLPNSSGFSMFFLLLLPWKHSIMQSSEVSAPVWLLYKDLPNPDQESLEARGTLLPFLGVKSDMVRELGLSLGLLLLQFRELFMLLISLLLQREVALPIVLFLGVSSKQLVFLRSSFAILVLTCPISSANQTQRFSMLSLLKFRAHYWLKIYCEMTLEQLLIFSSMT